MDQHNIVSNTNTADIIRYTNIRRILTEKEYTYSIKINSYFITSSLESNQHGQKCNVFYLTESDQFRFQNYFLSDFDIYSGLLKALNVQANYHLVVLCIFFKN